MEVENITSMNWNSSSPSLSDSDMDSSLQRWNGLIVPKLVVSPVVLFDYLQPGWDRFGRYLKGIKSGETVFLQRVETDPESAPPPWLFVRTILESQQQQRAYHESSRNILNQMAVLVYRCSANTSGPSSPLSFWDGFRTMTHQCVFKLLKYSATIISIDDEILSALGEGIPSQPEYEKVRFHYWILLRSLDRGRSRCEGELPKKIDIVGSIDWCIEVVKNWRKKSLPDHILSEIAQTTLNAMIVMGKTKEESLSFLKIAEASCGLNAHHLREILEGKTTLPLIRKSSTFVSPSSPSKKASSTTETPKRMRIVPCSSSSSTDDAGLQEMVSTLLRFFESDDNYNNTSSKSSSSSISWESVLECIRAFSTHHSSADCSNHSLITINGRNGFGRAEYARFRSERKLCPSCRFCRSKYRIDFHEEDLFHEDDLVRVLLNLISMFPDSWVNSCQFEGFLPEWKEIIEVRRNNRISKHPGSSNNNMHSIFLEKEKEVIGVFVFLTGLEEDIFLSTNSWELSRSSIFPFQFLLGMMASEAHFQHSCSPLWSLHLAIGTLLSLTEGFSELPSSLLPSLRFVCTRLASWCLTLCSKVVSTRSLLSCVGALFLQFSLIFPATKTNLDNEHNNNSKTTVDAAAGGTRSRNSSGRTGVGAEEASLLDKCARILYGSILLRYSPFIFHPGLLEVLLCYLFNNISSSSSSSSSVSARTQTISPLVASLLRNIQNPAFAQNNSQDVALWCIGDLFLKFLTQFCIDLQQFPPETE